MIKKLLLLILFFSFSCPVSAGQEKHYRISEQDLSLLELVNLTRNEPAIIADLLSVDPAALYKIPDDSAFWDNQKPGLYFEPSLQMSVTRLVTKLDGSDFLDKGNGWLENALESKVLETGYNPVRYADYVSLAVLTNYMSKDDAILALYRQFFLDQLEQFQDGKPSMFEYGLKGTGIRLDPIKLTFGGSSRNAYVFSAAFGRSMLNNLEVEIFAEINRFRKKPQQLLDFLGISRGEASNYYGGHGIVFMMESEPLIMNPSLISRNTDTNEPGKVDNTGDKTNDSAMFHWHAKYLDTLSTSKNVLQILKNFYHQDPHAFFQMVYDQDKSMIDVSVRLEPDDNKNNMIVYVARSGIESSAGRFWQGRVQYSEDCFDNENHECLDLPLDSTIVIDRDDGNSNLYRGVDDSGVFAIDLDRGKHSWELISQGDVLSAGEIFVWYDSQWTDIYICPP